jgi:hypothetical protein
VTGVAKGASYDEAPYESNFSPRRKLPPFIQAIAVWLVGQIVDKRPVGTFAYEKQLGKKVVLCQVRVFSFRVEHQLDDWPEKGERETNWFDADEAATLVEEGGLADIIDRFSGSYVRFVAFSKYELRHGRRHFIAQRQFGRE